ncbi:hypothetical protein E2C01_099881 [Portunus trituberculatus]|uniref:Uncharacterized protein n=1 Tax=Portunus trituberculatus TaxID=210409 RepID=A0A5B7KC26_PORTR|nr:hypothetical protein [Portunus trituberculatus]
MVSVVRVFLLWTGRLRHLQHL